MNKIIIVGGGQAGATVAQDLRKRGFEGDITILGDEPQLPYRRPPLSKTYLAGEATEESLYQMKAPILERNAIRYRGDGRVVGIDRAQRAVHLENGERLSYDKLVLTTGGRARPLPLPGAEAPNVHLLRTVADVDAIREDLASARRVVIIGGGFIGLEAAAVARKLGLEVTVLEGLPRVLARVTAPETSAFFEQTHRAHGVDVRTGAQVTGLLGSPTVDRVQLADGEELPADVVIVGIGLIPNTELAAEAGLDVDNGIVVDEFGRSSDPDILAAGDCTNHPNRFYGRRIRLESVNNALEQARTVSATIMGEESPYDSVPWFWSDQYDLKLQMVGLSEGYERCVLRGDMASRRFALFYLKDGVIIAADTVSDPKDFMVAKKLVAARVQASAEQLADTTVPLSELLPA